MFGFSPRKLLVKDILDSYRDFVWVGYDEFGGDKVFLKFKGLSNDHHKMILSDIWRFASQICSGIEWASKETKQEVEMCADVEDLELEDFLAED